MRFVLALFWPETEVLRRCGADRRSGDASVVSVFFFLNIVSRFFAESSFEASVALAANLTLRAEVEGPASWKVIRGDGPVVFWGEDVGSEMRGLDRRSPAGNVSRGLESIELARADVDGPVSRVLARGDVTWLEALTILSGDDDGPEWGRAFPGAGPPERGDVTWLVALTIFSGDDDGPESGRAFPGAGPPEPMSRMVALGGVTFVPGPIGSLKGGETGRGTLLEM